MLEQNRKDHSSLSNEYGGTFSDGCTFPADGCTRCTGETDGKKLRERCFEECFENAFRNGQFHVYLQPKVDTVTESVVEAEALVRWVDDSGEFIMPDEFIPVFERDGLIGRLDEYMFEKVCSYQRERLDNGGKVVPISVNLSRASLKRKGLCDIYKGIVETAGIPYSLVPLELTETDGGSTEESVTEFVRSGFVMQLDDFGAGYSSLANLSTLPFSVLKIDKSLSDQIGTPKGDIVVKYTVQIAHAMGLPVVAEGIETAEQFGFLKDIGCDSVQGYFFSPPLDIRAFEKILENGIK